LRNPNGEPLTERGRCLDTERLALAGVDESAPAPRILEVLPVEMARDIAGALQRVEAGTNITIDLALGADAIAAQIIAGLRPGAAQRTRQVPHPTVSDLALWPIRLAPVDTALTCHAARRGQT